MRLRAYPTNFTAPPEEIQDHLKTLARKGLRQWSALHRHIEGELSRAGLSPSQSRAMLPVLPQAAMTLLARGGSIEDVLEQVEYHGRRLAKLAVPIERVEKVINDCETGLNAIASRLQTVGSAGSFASIQHLRFCISITLNSAYHHVRQTEADAFYRLFAAELEASTLDGLLSRHIEVLRDFSGASAAMVCWRDRSSGRWVLKASSKQGTSRGTQALGMQELLNGPQRATRRGRRTKNVLRESAVWGRLASPRQFAISQTNRDLLLDPGWEKQFHYFWSIPLSDAEGLAGVMQFAFPVRYEWLPREVSLLNAAAEQCLMAAEKANLIEDLAMREEQVRELADRLSFVEERERRRISNELHDEAGQSLLLLRLQLEMLEGSPPEQIEDLRQRLRQMRELTERTILEIRRLLAALSPKVLERCGLAAALRQLASRFRESHPEIHLSLHLANPGTLDQKTEVMLYRLTQECLNNVAKHSGARNVNISLTSVDERLRLTVKDDGAGFKVGEAYARQDAYGLAGMRERVALLGGQFTLKSSPGKGTTISVDLPNRADSGRAVSPVADGQADSASVKNRRLENEFANQISARG